MVGHYTTGEQFHTTIPANDPEMFTIFRAHGVNIINKDQNSNYWLSMLVSIAPFALLLGLWFFLLRQMQSGGNKAMSFGKSSRGPPALHAAEEDHVQGRGGM